jgi:uncharacterized membrane protein YfhO
MLYTSNRGYDTIYELEETEGNLYMYNCNYTLPLGYMVTEGFENDTDYNDLNPLERQNELVHRISGIDADVFIPVYVDAEGGSASLEADADAHYYAYTSNTKIDNIKLSYDTESKSFSQIKKKYILDLGYFNAGDYMSLSSDNGETLNLVVYRVDEAVLSEFIDKLGANTMTVENYNETRLNGSIDVDKAGYLVMSIPYDPSWTLYVDGQKTEFDAFEDAFISVYLDEGSHTIALKYFPDGLVAGVIISIVSLILFILVCRYKKKSANTK